MPTPPIMSLAELRLAAQQRADMVNSAFVTNAEWTTYINGALFELYGLIIEAYGDDYFVAGTPWTITTAANTEFYPLASDHLKLLGVDLQLAAGPPPLYVSLRRFNFAERNQGMAPLFQLQLGRTNLRYRQSGNNLWLRPFPAAGLTVLLRYVPRMVPLSADVDTSDGYNGWLDLVIEVAAMKALAKEESDTSSPEKQRALMRARIGSEAHQRDAGQVATVVDVYQGADGYGQNGPWGMY